MTRISRLAVLATALASLFAVMSASAEALTWTNTGATSIHATGVGSTLHVGASGHLVCTGATAVGTAPATSTGSYTVTGTVTYTPCNLAGQNTFVTCSYSLTAQSHSLGGVTGVEADLTCDAKLTSGSIGLCHISGALSGLYNNPAVAGGTGTLTLLQSTSLTVSNFGSTSCPLGTGPGTPTHQTLTTTASGTPIIQVD